MFALAGLLPPFCGPLPGPGGHAQGGSPGVAGAAPDAGTAGVTVGGAAGAQGGDGDMGGEAGAPSEVATPDLVLGCDPLPWPRSPNFEILEGVVPARALGVSANGAVVVGSSGNQATIDSTSGSRWRHSHASIKNMIASRTSSGWVRRRTAEM